MKYVIYCRKSTDTEDRQVLSLESQENELVRLAESKGLEVVSILKESMSAKAEGRPVFNEVLSMIANGKADGIICWKLDRLARNFIDGGKIIDLLQKSIIKEICTYEGSHLPSDNVLMLAMHFGMANQYIRDLSTNVKRGNRAKLERGEWPGHAPFGYINDKITKTVKIDKKTSPYVVRTYNLYIAGKSYKEISDILFTEGLRTSSGKKVFKSQIQRMLTNPFYSGMMVRGGKYYEGKHKAIVSKRLFDEAQNVSVVRSRPKLKNLVFPLRGFLTCHSCGCNLTASLKKGHHYYYCTNGKGICSEHKSYLRENYLYEKVANLLDGLHFSKQKIELMYQAAKELQEQKTEYADELIPTLEATLDGLKTKESRLLDAFLGEQITKELYEEKTLALHNERISLSKQIKDLKSKQPISTLEPVKNIFLQANKARKEFLEADDTKKREIVENLLWNLSLESKNIVTVKYKSPFEVIAKAPKNGSISTLLASSVAEVSPSSPTRVF
jgi:site-specific DNA recombinase